MEENNTQSDERQRIADQYEADLIAEGFEMSTDPFSMVTFSSNNFGRKTDTEKAED